MRMSPGDHREDHAESSAGVASITVRTEGGMESPTSQIRNIAANPTLAAVIKELVGETMAHRDQRIKELEN